MSQLLFEIYQLLHVHQFISEHISQQEVMEEDAEEEDMQIKTFSTRKLVGYMICRQLVV